MPEPIPLQQPVKPNPPIPTPTDGGGLYRICGWLMIENPSAGLRLPSGPTKATLDAGWIALIVTWIMGPFLSYAATALFGDGNFGPAQSAKPIKITRANGLII